MKADQEPVEDENSTCPQSTYDDVQAGTSVTMTDASGTVVGLAALQSPRIDKLHEKKGAFFPYPSNCIYDFTVSNVPIGSAFFGFEVGHRGVVQLPAENAEAPELTLG